MLDVEVPILRARPQRPVPGGVCQPEERCAVRVDQMHTIVCDDDRAVALESAAIRPWRTARKIARDTVQPALVGFREAAPGPEPCFFRGEAHSPGGAAIPKCIRRMHHPG